MLSRLGLGIIRQVHAAQVHGVPVRIVELDEIGGEQDITAGEPFVDLDGAPVAKRIRDIGLAEHRDGQTPLPQGTDPADGQIGQLLAKHHRIEQHARAIIQVDSIAVRIEAEPQMQVRLRRAGIRVQDQVLAGVRSSCRQEIRIEPAA